LLLLAGDLARIPDEPLVRRHTRYDPELGWVSTPHVHLRDMYGPGVWLQTNAQGYRATKSYTLHVPPGRIRVVCSGDSFTLGFGVSNSEAWCERLSDKDPQIEPVNMGQAGYGLDQAYLWYRREATSLDHNVHVVAFIWDDFARMNTAVFNGFGKPVLRVRDDRLVVENVPVPRASYLAPALTAWFKRSRRKLSDLRTAELARRVRALLTDEEARTTGAARATWVLAQKVFDTLAELHRSRGTVLVLLHLPAADDSQYSQARHWAAELRTYAARTGVAYVDLGYDLQRLPVDSLAGIFGPHLHYTPLGNDWVATRLYAHFQQIPAIARLLEPDVGRPEQQVTGSAIAGPRANEANIVGVGGLTP
jgi:hypothetical protein